MTPPVVSNAGPLIALAKLNLLPLLGSLYSQVAFSRTVFAETVLQGQRLGHEDAQTLRLYLEQQGWQPTPVSRVPDDLDNARLDRGEKESIALALELQALLLIDEEKGRHEARQRGLRVQGTLGTLVQSHRRGLLTADQLRFHFHQIEARPDIWISPNLTRRLLKEVLG